MVRGNTNGANQKEIAIGLEIVLWGLVIKYNFNVNQICNEVR